MLVFLKFKHKTDNRRDIVSERERENRIKIRKTWQKIRKEDERK